MSKSKLDIHLENYEHYLVDLMDGLLNQEDQAQVMLFLEANPSIAMEFNELENFQLADSDHQFDHKEGLKRIANQSLILNAENYEMQFAAFAENDLDKVQQQAVIDFVTVKPQYASILSLFQKLKFTPATHVIFDTDLVKRIVHSPTHTINSFDQYCIAYFENDLTPAESIQLENLVSQSAEAASIFNSNKKTYFQADTSIVYPEKKALKKRGSAFQIGLQRIYMPSIAACVAMLLLYYILALQLDLRTSVNHTALNSNITGSTVSGQQQSTAGKTQETKVTSQSAFQQNTSSTTTKELNPISMAPSILQVKLVDKPEISMIKYQLPIQSFISAEDSSYYIYVAPPDVKVAESIVSTPQRTVKRLIGKLGRIMDQEKIALLNESPRESLRSISELAITGYSKMTESDIRLDN